MGDTEREAFEKAFKLDQFQRRPHAVIKGDYQESGTQCAWEGWQSRAALASRPAEVGDWISVDDRLPKDYERVLVLKDCGDGSLHSYAVGFVDRQSKDCWFADGYSGSLAYVGYRVTHWRELPAPSHTTNKEK